MGHWLRGGKPPRLFLFRPVNRQKCYFFATFLKVTFSYKKTRHYITNTLGIKKQKFFKYFAGKQLTAHLLCGKLLPRC